MAASCTPRHEQSNNLLAQETRPAVQSHAGRGWERRALPVRSQVMLTPRPGSLVLHSQHCLAGSEGADPPTTLCKILEQQCISDLGKPCQGDQFLGVGTGLGFSSSEGRPKSFSFQGPCDTHAAKPETRGDPHGHIPEGMNPSLFVRWQMG